MKRALLIVGGTVGGLGAVLSMTPPQLGVAHGGVSTLAAGSTSPVGSDVATQTSPTSVPQTTTPTDTPASSTPSAASTTTAPAATSPAASASSSTSGKPRSKATSTQKSTPKSTQKSQPAATKSSNASTSTPTKSSSPTPSQSQTQTQTPTPTPTQTPTPTPTKTTTSPTPTPTKTTATPTPVASGVSGTFTGATFDALEGNRNLWGRMTVTVTLKDGVISNINASQNPSSRSYNAISYLTSAVLNQNLSVKTVMSITPNSLLSQVRGYTGASYSAYAYWESLQSALSKAGL